MSAWSIIQIVLGLLNAVLKAANASGATQVVESVSAAIEKLHEVHNTPVTKAQVDALTIEKLW